MNEEDLARLKEVIDEYELSTGERSPLRDVLEIQAGTAGGAPFELPAVDVSPPEETPPPPPEPDVTIAAPGGGKVTEEPDKALQALAPQPNEVLQSLAPAPYVEPPPPTQEEQAQQARETAALRSAAAVRPGVMGRTEKGATEFITGGYGIPTGLEAVNKGLRQVVAESQKAAAGQEFDPATTLAGGMLGINPTAALVLGAGERGIPAVLEQLKTPESQYPPFQFATPAYAKPGEPELPVAGPDETPEQFALRMKDYETAMAQWQGKGLPLAAKPPEQPFTGKPLPPGLTPTAARIIQTAGGPQVMGSSDLAAMGVLGAATLGMMYAPTVYRAFRFNLTPRLRPVRDAFPGTMAISRPLDLARTYDDINAGLLRLARRAGVSPAAANTLEETFRIQSRSGARALADSAVQTGRMETPSFRFQAPTSLTDLQLQMTPQAQQYLLLRDTFDELNLMSQQRRFQPTQAQPQPGPPTVAGMTMQDVTTAMHALEQAHPEVIQISRDYNSYVRAVRRFESTGEYATRPTANPNTANPAAPNRSVAFLNSQRPNEVPFRGERSRGMAIPDRENPISAQAYGTRVAIRERLENEAVGQYVDTVRRQNSALFRRVTDEQLADNPQWKPNTVSFYRRGEKEHYTTDPFIADTLKMDPYYLTGMIGQVMFATKRTLEFGATGMGAPAFAPISLLRSWQIAKYTTERGFRSPSLLGSLYAIPRQLFPQMARSFSQSLEHGSGRWLSRVMGQPYVDALAQRLAREYDNSLYAQLKTVGTAKGSILEQQIQARALNRANAIFDQAGGPGRSFWHAWRALWESVHNGPAFNFVAKNLRAEPLPQLASRARALTGDPRRGGQYYVYGPKGSEYPIRFESDSRVTHTAAQTLRLLYGVPAELMRDTVPWFNATLQGAKRIGQAYMHDPIGFTRNTWLYAMAPAASAYLYARSLGNDPHGVSYTDYMLNRRSAYNRQMNWYIPIPGRPAEDGIEIPFFHELAPFKRAIEIALDHATRSNINSNAQDYWNAAHAFLDTAVIPPMPPVGGLLLAGQGMVAPQGVFGGDAYKKKNDPYDQTGGLPDSIELYTRAVGGGIGQTLGQAYAAYSQTPEGFWNGIANAAKAAGRVQIQRAPIIRDLTGIKPPLTGNTDLSRELFEKQKEIDMLAKFFQKWDKEGRTTQPGEISVEPKSKGGGLVADYLLGPALSPESPGIDQPEPTNPLYQQFMADVYARFRKESPLPVGSSKTKPGTDEGGIGFGTLWRRYGDATAKLDRLKNVNEGNYVTWQAQLAKRPLAIKELEDAGVDTTNLRQVKNFYETKRHDAARTILYTIRAVEADMSKQLGRPIKLKDLDPYGNPAMTGAPASMLDLATGFP